MAILLHWRGGRAAHRLAFRSRSVFEYPLDLPNPNMTRFSYFGFFGFPRPLAEETV